MVSLLAVICEYGPDPECDLYYAPNAAVREQCEMAISISLGFGGHNGVIALKKA